MSSKHDEEEEIDFSSDFSLSLGDESPLEEQDEHDADPVDNKQVNESGVLLNDSQELEELHGGDIDVSELLDDDDTNDDSVADQEYSQSSNSHLDNNHQNNSDDSDSLLDHSLSNPKNPGNPVDIESVSSFDHRRGISHSRSGVSGDKTTHLTHKTTHESTRDLNNKQSEQPGQTQRAGGVTNHLLAQKSQKKKKKKPNVIRGSIGDLGNPNEP